MRLKKTQKEKLLEWIAEGQQTDEINDRAAQLDTPFTVSRQQVDWYRSTRAVDIAALRSVSETDALTTGLAVRSERVRKLQQLAALLERDLFGGFLWTDQVKSIGSGPLTEIVDYEEFNGAEVIQYRGVLDDIAKEVGQRKQGVEVTGADGGPVAIQVFDYDTTTAELTARSGADRAPRGEDEST